MKRILIPTDYSASAFEALAFAERLALQMQGEIFLMHLHDSVDLTVHAAGVVATADLNLRAQNRSELFRLADELEHQGLRVHSIFVEDRGEQKIEDYLLPYNIDLIVMGSRGLTGLPSVIGSTTRSVIRHAHLPVIIFSEESDASVPVKKILFASTFRKDERASIFITNELALLLNAELHITFLNHPGHLIEEKAARALVAEAAVGIPLEKWLLHVVNTNHDQLGIEQVANEVGANMIAVSEKQNSFLSRITGMGLTESLISSQNRPVLSLP